MTLIDVVSQLAALDPDETIYAVKPWSQASPAVVAAEPDDCLVPPERQSIGASYFNEVFAAREFLDDGRTSERRPIFDAQLCERSIRYATTDA